MVLRAGMNDIDFFQTECQGNESASKSCNSLAVEALQFILLREDMFINYTNKQDFD